MKYIEATWEKHNLNKTTLEILVDDTDKTIDISTKIESGSYEYIVAKIPSRKPNIVKYFQSNGFNFTETQISLYRNITEQNDNRLEQFLNKFGFVKISSKSDLSIMLKNIESNMFSTDRIALDENFGIEIANSRYINWITNEFENRNIDIFNISKKDKPIGFVMAKVIENEVNILLGGIFSKYQNHGYGTAIVYKPIEFYKNLNKTILRTKTSSNNPDILKIYLSAGYMIENFEYVFVKHLNRS